MSKQLIIVIVVVVLSVALHDVPPQPRHMRRSIIFGLLMLDWRHVQWLIAIFIANIVLIYAKVEPRWLILPSSLLVTLIHRIIRGWVHHFHVALILTLNRGKFADSMLNFINELSLLRMVIPMLGLHWNRVLSVEHLYPGRVTALVVVPRLVVVYMVTSIIVFNKEFIENFL